MAEQHSFPQSADADYAENFGQMIGQPVLSNTAPDGMGFTVDYTVPDVTIGTGVCFIKRDTVTISGNNETRRDVNEVIQLSQATKSLTDNDVNHIYVEPNFGTDDSGSYSVETNTANASANALKIGEIDTSNDTSTTTNRGASFDAEPPFRILNGADNGSVLVEVTGSGPLTFVSADLDLGNNAITNVDSIGGGGSTIEVSDAVDISGETTAHNASLDTEWMRKQEGGLVEAGSIVPIGQFGLADGESLAVSQAVLSEDGFTTPADSGIDLRIVPESATEGSTTGTKLVLGGDGTTLYDDETSGWNYTNNSGGHQTVIIGVDNGAYGSGTGQDTEAYGGYMARVV